MPTRIFMKLSEKINPPPHFTLTYVHQLTFPYWDMGHRRGNLWPYSTAKLEARGGRCKHIVRRQTSARPRAAQGGVAKTKHSIAKRGGSKAQKKKGIVVEGSTSFQKGYNSSQMCQLLGMVALREKRVLNTKSAHFARESVQLAQIGKMVKRENKVHTEVPEAFAGIVPADHPFTCCTIFESILQGKIPLLYGLDGVCKRSVPDEDDPPRNWSEGSPLRGNASAAPASA